MLAHPTAGVTKVTDLSTDLSLLSYGALEQTFVALARSDRLLDQAAAGMGLQAASADRYHAVANVPPHLDVLEDLRIGRRPRRRRHARDRLAASRDDDPRALPIFSLTPLDRPRGRARGRAAQRAERARRRGQPDSSRGSSVAALSWGSALAASRGDARS